MNRWSVTLAMLMALPLPASAAVGDLDPQFGEGRQVLVGANLGPHVLELPDGRVLVVGDAVPVDEATPSPADGVALSRFLATGAPDLSFGNGGRVVVDLFADNRPASITAATLQSDGKIVLAGWYWEGGGQPFVARVTADGSLDPTFGAGGRSEPFSGGTEPHYSALIAREDGEILAAISDWTSDRIDRFGSDGRPLGNLNGTELAPARMARQGDGRLIVSGYHRALKRQGVVRIAEDGSIDPSFGDQGFAVLEDGYSGNLAIEPGTDRIVLCGPGIVRLTADGHPDTTFGVSGTSHVRPGSDGVPTFNHCQRLLTMWDGTLAFVAIRQGQAEGGYDLAFVAGLSSSGVADLRFGGGSGASELDLGSIRGSTAWWDADLSNAMIATRDGDALLTWMSTDGLRLARIELNAGQAPAMTSPPPVSQPPPPPASPAPAASNPPQAVAQNSGNGGGGSIAWFELVLLAAASAAAARARRRHAEERCLSRSPPSLPMQP